MKLSTDQAKALDRIHKWQHGHEGLFILAGYAGTGKTTLVQHFINQQDDPVVCLAPTGKAASVLQKKLKNARVSTIHKALYMPSSPSTADLDQLEAELVLDPENTFLQQAIADEKARLAAVKVSFSLKADSEISPGQLVVIDEASMVTSQMLNDLLRTEANLLFVGDPGQLPPVFGRGFFQDNKPDVVLSNVHRQALDSPIIRASISARCGESIPRTSSAPAAFRKMDKSELASEEWLSYDQVITGSNDSRRRINRYFRKKKGLESIWPQKGEKLICLKNDNNVPVLNGVQGLALSDAGESSDTYDLIGDILYDETNIIKSMPLYRYPFQIHYDPAAVEEHRLARQGLGEFDYAYAITVHKSQGSEWNRVLLADDGMRSGDADFRKLWLYTAITRAKEELTWLS